MSTYLVGIMMKFRSHLLSFDLDGRRGALLGFNLSSRKVSGFIRYHFNVRSWDDLGVFLLLLYVRFCIIGFLRLEGTGMVVYVGWVFTWKIG